MKNNIQYKALVGLKGIYALMIFLLHFCGIYNDIKVFSKCYIFCEGFFILSGFLFGTKFINASVDIVKWLKNKLLNLYPKYFASLILMILLWIFIPKMSRYYMLNFSSVVGEFLLLQCASIFKFQLINGVSWFVSALLLAQIFLLIIYKIMGKKFKYILPIIILCSYSIIFTSCGTLNVHGYKYAFLYLGTIRALGGVALGLLLFLLKYEKKFDLNKQKINFIETLSFLAIVLLIFSKTKTDTDFIFPILFGLQILCASYETGLISKILKSKFFSFLGKISYEIYLFQDALIYLIAIYAVAYKKMPFMIIIGMIGCIVFSYLIHLLFELIKKNNRVKKVKII